MKNIRRISNLFDDATDTDTGVTAGLSQSWYGNGYFELVTLDNPGNVAVQMERLESNIVTAQWVPVGDPTRTSIQVINMFSAGFQFRARMLESAGTNPVRLTTRGMQQMSQNSITPMLEMQLSKGHIVGFAPPDINGVVEYGDFEALKKTTAFMFFCFDPDATLNAEFGGPWFKYGVDYIALHTNQVQLTLTQAITNYNNNGGTDTTGTTGTGGTTGIADGEVGGAPITHIGVATLASPPVTSLKFEIYSSISGEIFWGDAPDETSADVYEVSIGGIVVYVGSANTKAMYNLSASTNYIASIVRYRADGSHAPAVTVSATTLASGETVDNTTTLSTGTSTPTDGAATTFGFYEFDAHERTYVESGAGSPAQIWEQKTTLTGYTGAGYLRVSNVSGIVANGAAAVYTNRTANDEDRVIRMRVRADVAGSSFAVYSQGNGVLGVVTVNQTDWHWVESPAPWSGLDSSFHMVGMDGGISVDKVIVQHSSDPAYPTGQQGLYNA